MDTLMRDIKYAGRSLVRAKGFTATVVVTLAVCIAISTAIFAIVYSVLLRPLPVPDADSILLMSNRYPKAGIGDLNFSSAADYYDRLRDVSAFKEQAMFRFANQAVEINGTPQQVRGMAATPSLFRLLQVPAAVGRTFTQDEGELGKDQEVILSYGMWQKLYGGDQAAVGRELLLGGRNCTVVGIMPRNFVFLDPDVDVWVPLAFTPQEKRTHHNNNWYNIGRLKPGATLEQARSQIEALNAANLDRFPQWKQMLINAGFYTQVEPLQELLVGSVKDKLYFLWGGAIVVLLIGGLNITNLAIARLNVRKRELATRLALGARRSQLLRQLVVEHVLASLIGGAVGVALGAVSLKALAVLGLNRFPRAYEVGIDGKVILVAMVIAAVIGVAIGLILLLDLLREDLNSMLHDDRRTASGKVGASRVRKTLVSVQIGFAFVLLVCAVLFMVSFRQLLGVDPGFQTDRILTASLRAPRAKYPDAPQLRSLMNRSLESIRRIPGVASAGATTTIPLGGNYADGVIMAEGYVMKKGESVVSPRRITVTPGYLKTMNVSLLRGRYFQESDNENAPAAVIVDETLAKKFWGSRDPVGQRMFQPQNVKNPMQTDEKTRWYQVVGVVHAVRLEDLTGKGNPVGVYYFPYAQDTANSFVFAVKYRGDLSAMAHSLRTEMAKIDPQLPLFDVRTMEERTELSMATRKSAMMLALVFSGVALFLASIGIYGVLAYLVTQRRREIGIRVALGSPGQAIVKLVVREGLILGATGVVLGIAGIVALRAVLRYEVYGIGPLDPWVMASIAALLLVVTMAASIEPARRAVRLNPTVVLSE